MEIVKGLFFKPQVASREKGPTTSLGAWQGTAWVEVERFPSNSLLGRSRPRIRDRNIQVPPPPTPSKPALSSPLLNPLSMAPTPDLIPLDSPLRTHAKRGLPATMSSTSAHGHISGHARTAAQQKTFDQSKARILRTMSPEQIEGAYWDTVKKINTILEDDQKKKEEIQREIDKLTAQRDLERRIFKKQKEEKERRMAATVTLAPTSVPDGLDGLEEEGKESKESNEGMEGLEAKQGQEVNDGNEGKEGKDETAKLDEGDGKDKEQEQQQEKEKVVKEEVD